MPKRIFAVLYVSVMGLTRCYKTTVFFTFITTYSAVLRGSLLAVLLLLSLRSVSDSINKYYYSSSSSSSSSSAFVYSVRWAGTFASGGRRTMPNALMSRNVTINRYLSP